MLLFEIYRYLPISDIGRMATVSHAARETALDNCVWRRLSLRAFPDLVGPSYKPADGSWVAEYKERRDSVKRQREYQRLMVMGAAGLRRGTAPSRLKVPRFDYLGSGAVDETRRRVIESKDEASTAAVPDYDYLRNIDAASAIPRITARQGSCSWSVLPPVVITE